MPCGLRRVRLFVTLWTVAHRAPLSREFSRQEYWSGLPFSSPGDLPDPGIELESLMPLVEVESHYQTTWPECMTSFAKTDDGGDSSLSTKASLRKKRYYTVYVIHKELNSKLEP